MSLYFCGTQTHAPCESPSLIILPETEYGLPYIELSEEEGARAVAMRGKHELSGNFRPAESGGSIVPKKQALNTQIVLVVERSGRQFMTTP